MAGKWKVTTVDEIKADTPNAIAMGPFGSRIKTDNFVSTGIPVIRGNNLNAERLLDDQFVFLTEAKADELRASNAFPGDIVITHRGTLGQVGIIPHDAKHSRYVVSQSQMKLTVDLKKADPFYIFYYLRSTRGQHELLANASQTGVPAIARPTSSLRVIVVPLPPLNEQRAIAHILGMLDDKIELNRWMNETLEETARAIFKSWFVDFDPVRAKAEGRDPGLPEHIDDLFPDGFENSEMGEIPAGWDVMPIGDAVRVVGGGTPSTKEPAFWEGGIHCWATPKDLSKLQDPILLDTERKVTDAGLAKISSGLLPTGTVLLSSRAPVGYLAVARVPVSVNQGFIAMVCEGPLTNHYALHWALSNMEQIEGRASGTTFQEISKKNFRPILALVPADGALATFEEQVSPLYDKIAVNLHQSRALAAIRDALLPRLIAGELRVPDAKRMVDEVMP